MEFLTLMRYIVIIWCFWQLVICSMAAVYKVPWSGFKMEFNADYCGDRWSQVNA
jgi:hypothetical protein